MESSVLPGLPASLSPAAQEPVPPTPTYHTPESVNSCDRSGYVGDQSVLATYSAFVDNDSLIPEMKGLDEVSQQILRITGATTRPAESMLRAMADLYFEHVWHRMPVLNRGDLCVERPPIMICQALCMVGCVLRQPRPGQSTRALSYPYYRRVKSLLDVNVEPDHQSKLKVLCLLTIWSMTPPSVVTLDTPWHWNGVAIRLSQQMGLHRECTYVGRPDSKITRRIWWTIVNYNVQQAACFGRPLGVKLDDFDTQLPTIDDFEDGGDRSLMFIEYSKLCMIMCQILGANAQRQRQCSYEATHIIQALQQWIGDLPEPLKLYQGVTKSPYRLYVLELYITYFVCVILFFRMCTDTTNGSISITGSVLASSCIAHIYQDMSYRDGINSLVPIHNWFAMVASVPLIQLPRSLHLYYEQSKEDLSIIIEMLDQMSIKFPAAAAVLARIRYLQQEHDKEELPLPPSQGSRRRDPENPRAVAHQDPNATLQALFPFPNSMCPNMELLIAVDEEPDLSSTLSQMEPTDEPIQWILNNNYDTCGLFDFWPTDKNNASLDNFHWT